MLAVQADKRELVEGRPSAAPAHIGCLMQAPCTYHVVQHHAYGCVHMQQFTTSSALLLPHSEILLRPYQFCNLTEVIIRESDDIASLKRKARLATILGTFQATLVSLLLLVHVTCTA